MRMHFHPSTPKGFWVYADTLRAALKNGEEVGSGSYGKIIPVESRSGTIVAAKIPIDDKGKPQVKREGRVLYPLSSHPNVVEHYAHGEIDGNPFIILELLKKGVDLEQIYEGIGPIGLPYFLPTLEDITRGILHLHAQNIVHRDIKPSSIFVFDDHSTKILDFGIACQEGIKMRREEEADNLVFYTPAYASPSILLGNPPTAQDDLYSLGLLSLDILTGKTAIDEIRQAYGYSEDSDGYLTCHDHLEEYVLNCGLGILGIALVLKLTTGYENEGDFFPTAFHLLKFLEGIRTGEIFI